MSEAPLSSRCLYASTKQFQAQLSRLSFFIPKRNHTIKFPRLSPEEYVKSKLFAKYRKTAKPNKVIDNIRKYIEQLNISCIQSNNNKVTIQYLKTKIH